MRNNQAFTLLELLISISLSSFIMLGLIQGYRNTMNFVENAQAMIQTNRRVFLLFNQLEKDLSTAFMPTMHKKIKPLKESKKLGEVEKEKEQKQAEQKKLKPEDEKKAQADAKEKKKKFFMGEMGDGDALRIDGRKVNPFKNVTFIATNALQIYGQKKARFVRVKYELVVDKSKKQKDKVSYKLMRKETAEVENIKMKVSEFDDKATASKIRTHVVADDIKGMYVEYVTYKKEKQEKDKKGPHDKPVTQEELRSSTWGEKEYSKGVVPQRLEVQIDFWNNAMTAHHSFKTTIPIWSYPTLEEKKKKKDAAGDMASIGMRKPQEGDAKTPLQAGGGARSEKPAGAEE